MEDFWPDLSELEKEKQQTPFSIVKDIANLLGEKSGGRIKAEICKSEELHSETSFMARKCEFEYIFYIISSKISYSYRYFSFSYPIGFYPVYFTTDEDLKTELRPLFNPYGIIEVSNEKALIDTIRIILSSNRTKKVLRSILAQYEQVGY